MAKKFKILQAAAKLPPTALTNYKEFRAGDRTITRSVNPDLGPKKIVFLYPFGLEAAPGSHTAVSMSNKAFLAIGNLLDSGLTILNLAESGAQDTATTNPALTPAKATINQKGTKKETNPISGITGQSYKAYNNESFTFPFGQNATGVSYCLAIQKEILDAVEAKQPKNSVTFKPERWRRV